MSASNGNTGAANELAEAFRLLFTDPARSESLCRAALARRDDPTAQLMLAGARRLQGDYAKALELSDALSQANPTWPGAAFERAMALGGLGRHAEALDALQRAAQFGPMPGLWRETGDRRWALGDRAGAEEAYLRHLDSTPPFEPLVHQAFAAVQQNAIADAEAALRLHLSHYPADPLAIRHLAEILSSTDRYEEAEALLRRLLERTPAFALGRYGLANVLMHDHRLPPALEQVDRLLAREPRRLEYLNLKADILGRLGDSEAAAACLETILAIYPNDGGAWTAYGHALRTLGRRAECEDAYRKAIAAGVHVGEAYWGLANLKTYRFTQPDVAAMRDIAERSRESDDRTALLFALGKALEDQAQPEAAFAIYTQANAARRARLPHDQEDRLDAFRRARALFIRFLQNARRGRQPRR